MYSHSNNQHGKLLFHTSLTAFCDWHRDTQFVGLVTGVQGPALGFNGSMLGFGCIHPHPPGIPHDTLQLVAQLERGVILEPLVASGPLGAAA